MKVSRFLKCYTNPIVTILAAVFYAYFGAQDGGEGNDKTGMLYVLSAIFFAFLGVWVFTIGAVVALVQVIYGSVKHARTKQNSEEYQHYFIGFGITAIGYAIIFLIPVFQSIGVL
ncbi:MAG: hypothetical protein ACI89S_002422 [Gammaproteobacteria bacterium]|jgi:hypothetical protein